MRRVLMLSPHFPPDASAGAHRVRLIAPHLPAYGWEPTVVTMDPRAYEGRLDTDLSALVPETLRVVRVGAWPAHVTRRLGLGDLGLRGLTGLQRACDRLLGGERFDALFITVYPTYPALLGPRLKARHDLPFVLDYQDPWVGRWGQDVGGGPDGAPDLKSRATRAIAARLEPRVVRHADALTAVSSRTYEEVLARVPDARPRACADIPLGFEERDAAPLRTTPRPNPWFDTRDGLVHVCYVGTILPTGVSVLRRVLAAAAEMRRQSPALFARLRFHFLGTSNVRHADAPARVVPIARELGLADAVTEVAPRLDYLDALNVQMQASALLLMGSTEPHYTPSKAYPAVLARRPVVAVYHSASSVLDLLRHPSVDARVVTFDDERSLEGAGGALRQALHDAAAGALRVPDASTEGLERWSARSLAGRLAGVLDRVA